MPGTPAHLQYVAPRPAHRPRPRDEVARPGGQRGFQGVAPLGQQGPGLANYLTILEIGIDRMSRAPAAFSFGISVLTLCLGTTVSTAFMSPRASVVTVGEDSAGSIAVTAASSVAGTFILSSTLPRASMAPRRSSAMSSIAARLSASP